MLQDIQNLFTNITIVQGEFSTSYVLLSLLFVVIGTYTSLSMHERIHDNSLFPKTVWYVLSAFAMAFGIWSMHYMGMFAFELPLKVSYSLMYTILSLVPIFVASYTAFYLSNSKKPSMNTAVLTSLILAIGVLLMHMLGMYSFKSDVAQHYEIGAVLISLSFSFVAHMLLYVLRVKLNNKKFTFLLAIVMGGLFSATHYFSMGGMKLHIIDESKILTTVQPVDLRWQSATVLTAIFGAILFLLTLSKIADKYVQYRAENFDVLTKLPNIRMFEQMVERNEGFYVAIVQLKDLHKCIEETNFNDRERVLQKIAQVIEMSITSDTTLYRTDYYQFALVAKASDEEFTESLQRIKRRLLKTSKYLQGEKFIPPFIIANAKRESSIPLEMIYERLLEKVKSIELSNDVVSFEHELNKKTDEQIILESFATSLQNGEFSLVYQPKLIPLKNTFNSVEALIRWHHHERGFMNPGEFIPVLEKSEAIYELTNWIINEVAKQLSEWNELKIGIQCVSINIPGTYVTKPQLKFELMNAITHYKLNVNQIELEITETSYISNIEEASAVVKQLRDLGFMIAIDDFGTGLSSLSYLKQLPITTLKIDKSFIDDVPYSEKDSEILLGIISIANSLNLNIVIEGVEYEEQKQFIVNHFNHVLIQGFYYSKPLPKRDVELLKESTLINIDM